MSNWSEAAHTYSKDNFEMDCTYCGSRFDVFVAGQKGHEAREEYFCPECNKEYATRASLSPKVTLISGRTDGKNDLYSN